MVVKTVKETIAKYGLLETKDKILLAFSGGMDSTALLGIFLELRNEWDLELFLGHFNHKLRPDADPDEQFVRKVAQKHALPLFAASEDVRGYAKRNRLNVEEAGRLLRYGFLSQTAQRIGKVKIATGHTLNDQAETFFQRLFRGAGPRGLGGISPAVEGRIIRPLLRLERREIAEYVRKNKMEFREDESNRDRDYSRNKIRLELIPYIQEHFDPDIVRRIGTVATILQEEDRFLNDLASREAEKMILLQNEGVFLDTKRLSDCPLGLARRVIRDFIKTLKGDLRDISFEDVESLLDLGEGKAVQLAKDIVIMKKDGRLLRRPSPAERVAFEYTWKGSSPCLIPELSMKIQAFRTTSPDSLTFDFDDDIKAYVDSKSIRFPLLVRNRREGDRYQPLGAPGKKKLKEIMRAKGIPLRERDKKPVFLSGDEIVWVCGLPVAENFKVKEKTEEVIVLTCSPIDKR